MSDRTLLVAISAWALGIVTALLVSILLPRSPMVTLIVAAEDIPVGATITAEMLATREYPKELVPAGSYETMKYLIDGKHTAQLRIDRGGPILSPQVSTPADWRKLIPPGRRGATVLVAYPSGIGGFILPRNRVDVLLTIAAQPDPDAPEKLAAITSTIVQNVEVLAAGPSAGNGFQSMVLIVTPDQDATLQLASIEGGILHLSLRNPKDDEIAEPAVAVTYSIREPQGHPFQRAAQARLFEKLDLITRPQQQQPAGDGSPAP